MNPGLLYLLARVPLSKLRQMKRRAKGLKGALVFGIALLMFGLMILPQFLASRQLDPARMQRTSDIIRLWGPPALLLFSLLFGVAPARIVFKPAETALLFPAPVSRRELLLYHVAGRFARSRDAAQLARSKPRTRAPAPASRTPPRSPRTH